MLESAYLSRTSTNASIAFFARSAVNSTVCAGCTSPRLVSSGGTVSSSLIVGSGAGFCTRPGTVPASMRKPAPEITTNMSRIMAVPASRALTVYGRRAVSQGPSIEPTGDVVLLYRQTKYRRQIEKSGGKSLTGRLRWATSRPSGRAACKRGACIASNTIIGSFDENLFCPALRDRQEMGADRRRGLDRRPSRVDRRQPASRQAQAPVYPASRLRRQHHRDQCRKGGIQRPQARGQGLLPPYRASRRHQGAQGSSGA